MKSEENAPGPWLAAARISFHEKKYKRCLSQAEDALERSPQNAEAYYWRGRCYEAKGNPLEAANEYKAALKAEAAHPQAHEGLSRIQANLGGTDAAPTAN
jgi:tetratricopeptide (TPR) repeat protein